MEDIKQKETIIEQNKTEVSIDNRLSDKLDQVLASFNKLENRINQVETNLEKTFINKTEFNQEPQEEPEVEFELG